MSVLLPSHPRPNLLRRIAIGVGTVLAIGMIAVAPSSAVADSGNLHCTGHQVPVGMTDGGPLNLSMFGQLCYSGTQAPDTVQLLVHGATYNHLYWDFPYQRAHYSYVHFATAAGYATFSVDRIGAGQSSHPQSGLLYTAAGS